MLNDKIQILPSGDSAMLVRFGSEISELINKKVHELTSMLEEARLDGIIEMVPSYTDLLILYDPQLISFKKLYDNIHILINKPSNSIKLKSKLIKIPVCYDEEFGIDLKEVASHTSLAVSEIINIHSSAKYLVYMLGFTPGFPYLGGMDDRIACPRKKIPRQDIAAGSIGIADKQTGIYPIESPGGWQIIGKTPLKLFDLSENPSFLCNAGDYLQFYPIDKAEYLTLISKHS